MDCSSGAQLQSIGLLFVSGMIAHVSSAAAVGRKLTMAEAWAATRGKRWRLLVMAFLLGLVVVLAVGVAAGILIVGVVAFDAPVGAAVLVGARAGRDPARDALVVLGSRARPGGARR